MRAEFWVGAYFGALAISLLWCAAFIYYVNSTSADKWDATGTVARGHRPGAPANCPACRDANGVRPNSEASLNTAPKE